MTQGYEYRLNLRLHFVVVMLNVILWVVLPLNL